MVGAATINGTVAPGASIGTLNFSSTLTLNDGSKASMEINNTDGTRTADRAAASGAVAYAGKLKLTYSGNQLNNGDSFTLFTGSGYSGAFTGLELVGWPDTSKRVVLSSLTTDGTISIAANTAPTAADTTLKTTKNTANAFAVAKYAGDLDGDFITVTVSDPANGTAAVVNGKVQYTPDTDFVGSETFTYTVADPSGPSDAGTVSVTVTDPSGEGLTILNVQPNVPASGQATITYAGRPGHLYDVERAEVATGPWTDIGDSTASELGTTDFVDTSAPGSAFYRMKSKSAP